MKTQDDASPLFGSHDRCITRCSTERPSTYLFERGHELRGGHRPPIHPCLLPAQLSGGPTLPRTYHARTRSDFAGPSTTSTGEQVLLRSAACVYISCASTRSALWSRDEGEGRTGRGRYPPPGSLHGDPCSLSVSVVRFFFLCPSPSPIRIRTLAVSGLSKKYNKHKNVAHFYTKLNSYLKFKAF